MNAYRSVCSVCVSSAVLLTMLCMPTEARAQKTLQTFGVQVQHGQPVYPLPANVALGLFNPEDPFLDAAYANDGRVQVFQNLGNGLFSGEPVFDRRVSGEVAAMQWRMRNPYFRSPSDLVITYTDGREETIANEWMREQTRSFASLPQTANSFPPLNFREVWRSASNRVTSYDVWVDDIDSDGRIEAIYYLYEGPPAADGRLMVYENVGNNQYVLDWDTLMINGGYPMAITDIDNDGHKEIVVGYDDGAGCGVGLLECFGPRRYRFYRTNLCTARSVVKVLETDVDHDGIKELSVLTSDSFPGYDRTFVYIAEFVGKGQAGGGGWSMAFNQQIARFDSYVVEFAVAQVDGQGWDEIILGSGGFLSGGAEDITYLKYTPPDGPFAWRPRYFSVGLPVLCTTPMVINLDADSTKEIVIGGVGPLGHGSMYAIKYVSDSTWTTMWIDSSFRSSPLWVNRGLLYETPVVAGANYWRDVITGPWSQWRAYQYTGEVSGFWRTDSTITIHQFHLLDIDRDSLPNLVFAQLSLQEGHRFVDYEIPPTLRVGNLAGLPEQTMLHQNYPNPFNPSTQINFDLPEDGFVTLNVFDVLGRKVAEIANGNYAAGYHSATWNVPQSGIASGVYFARFTATDANGHVKLNKVSKLLLSK